MLDNLGTKKEEKRKKLPISKCCKSSLLLKVCKAASAGGLVVAMAALHLIFVFPREMGPQKTFSWQHLSAMLMALHRKFIGFLFLPFFSLTPTQGYTEADVCDCVRALWCFYHSQCTGFMWQDFGSNGAAGVVSVRRHQELPTCQTEAVPAGSTTDPPMARSKPVTNVGSTSVITY